MASGFGETEQKLRDDLIEFVREREYSDAPLRTFRIQSYVDYKKALNLTIQAKTQVGAIIAYADWSLKEDNAKSEMSLQWEVLVDILEQDPPKDTSIQGCVEKLIDVMFGGGDDNIIVEVTDLETITPFSDTFRESTGKNE